VGLPAEIGGIPLDRLGATGFGIAECAEVACPYAGIGLKGARVAIQGYGSVGRAAARFLSGKGALIVAVSDTKGTIYTPDGIVVPELEALKASTGSVMGYGKALQKRPDEIFGIDCDILIPAATPDVLTGENIETVRARLILQGANIPVTADAEKWMHEKGILSVPDIIVNSGGTIMAAMEYEKRPEKEAFEAVSLRVRSNTKLLLERAMSEKIPPRQAANAVARARIADAMKYREY
jgi:glutamate dehydrogenase/leucine dehydrogenase